MLSLSKKTDYALLALSYLARIESDRPDSGRADSGRADGERAANTREIAEQFDIPVEMLAKILQTLAKARLITSTPGPTGGYRLARPAAEITVAAAIEAVDGPPAIAQCLKVDGNRCEQIGKCTIRKPLTRINLRILQMLSLISLAEISSDDEETVGYPILQTIRRPATDPVAVG